MWQHCQAAKISLEPVYGCLRNQGRVGRGRRVTTELGAGHWAGLVYGDSHMFVFTGVGWYEGDPSYRHSPGKTDRTCPMPAPRSFGSFRKFSQRREILLPESGTMKTVLCCMKGGLFAADRPVWLYNSNLQAASLHHSTSHSSGSSSAGFCTILKTFYLLPRCIVRLA